MKDSSGVGDRVRVTRIREKADEEWLQVVIGKTDRICIRYIKYKMPVEHSSIA